MRRTTITAVAAAAVLGTLLAPAAGAISPASGDRRVVDTAPTASWNRLAPGQAASDRATVLPTGEDAYGFIRGSSRYDTAVQISKVMVCDPGTSCTGLGDASHPIDSVFIASGTDFPDALGAGPIASGLGPLLLVPPSGTVPAVVLDELDRIDPNGLIVFGNSTLSTGVIRQLRAHTQGGKANPSAPCNDASCRKIGGFDRYDTAARGALLNDEIWRAQDDDGDGTPDNHGLDTIVLASGQTYADALAGGGAAANSRGSLLLTRGTELPPSTKDALQQLQPPTIYITGGYTSVSKAVEDAVRAAVPASTVTRVAGPTRFDTATLMSKKIFPGSPNDGVFLVSAYNFPDALSTAPLAGYYAFSTLLAKKTCVPLGTRNETSRMNVDFIVGIGGVVGNDAILMNIC